MIGGLERRSGRPGSDGAVTEVYGHGVVAMDGVNVVKPSGYSGGKGIWGLEIRRPHDDLRTVMANARSASRGRCGPATGDVGTCAPATAHRFSHLRSARSAHAGHRKSNVSKKCVGAARCGARLVRAWIYVVDKGGASVSADRAGSRRFATMAQIESKHDVRRKVRDAQAQVNRERLKRESDNREDMVAFLVAEQKLSAVRQWEA